MTLPRRSDAGPLPPDDPATGTLLLEVGALAAAIAIPLPVPALLPVVLVASIALWVRGGSWTDVGLTAGPRWLTHALLGLALGAAALLADALVLGPSLDVYANRTFDIGAATPVRGHLMLFASSLVLAAAVAAGVEMVFRGYLLDRMIRLLGPDSDGFAPDGAGLGLPVIAAAGMYAWFAADGGIGGVVGGLAFGIGYALLYLAGRRNLVLPIAFHFAFEGTNLLLIYLRVAD